MPPEPPRRLHLFVTVWGESHVERWARQSLASQLSAGNLPALAARGVQLDYHVFTDTASLALLRERTRDLQPYAEVHLRDIATHEYGARSFAQRVAGLDDGRAKHTLNATTVEWMLDHVLALGGTQALAILDNDFLFPDGALDDAFAALRHGARVIAVPVLRLMAQAIPDILRRLAQQAPGTAGLGLAELCAGLPHTLHPISRRLDAASPRFSRYPTSVLWPVGEEGWLCRSYMPHPLMVVATRSPWRARSTVDYTLALSLHRGEDDARLPHPQERIAAFKCTPAEVYQRFEYPERTLTAEGMAQFLFFHTNRNHGRLARQAVRLPRRFASEAEAGWLEAEAATLAQLESWYEYLDRNGPGIDTGILAERWRISHYGSIDEYLCPGRIVRAARRDPAMRAFLPALDMHYVH